MWRHPVLTVVGPCGFRLPIVRLCGASSVQCCFMSIETIRTIRDGETRMATSTFTQLLSSEMWRYNYVAILFKSIRCETISDVTHPISQWPAVKISGMFPDLSVTTETHSCHVTCVLWHSVHVSATSTTVLSQRTHLTATYHLSYHTKFTWQLRQQLSYHTEFVTTTSTTVLYHTESMWQLRLQPF